MNQKTAMAVAIGLLTLPGFALAQGKSQEELAALRDDKMALEVFQKANWMFDYDDVLAEAKKTDKIIFAYFTRSYSG